MTKELRMLAPESFREALSRRAFLKVGTVAAGLAVVVVACGGSDSPSDTTGSSDTTTPGGTAPSGVASGDWSRVINQASGTLAMYTWGD
ncbi:MAG: twin-arginine translocation signal domain-containing protein, partial [Actinomycetota bacterium]